MASMTRGAFLSLFLIAGSAIAAPKKGAIGSSKEDEPCPAPVVTSGRDVALLRGLSFAFEPAPAEIRAQAIEDLGFLGDPRALNALAVLSLDPNPMLSRAAIRAVGTMRHQRAEEILGNLVRHPTVPATNRQLALSLLPFQNTVTALRQVHLFANSGGTTEVTFLARSMASQLRAPSADEVPAPVPMPLPAAEPAPASAPIGDSK